MEKKLIEIWSSEWTFQMKLGNKNRPYTVKDVVCSNLPQFFLTSQPFYMDRALRDLGEKLIKTFEIDKKTGLPFATIKFTKFINYSFVEPY